MKLTIILFSFIIFLFSCKYDNNSNERYGSTNDSLTLLGMVHDREGAMKKKNINAVMAQFSDDATFINGDGYYLANKAEIEEFHKGLTQSDSISYYYIVGNVHIRMLDEKNALVYYPNKMEWYKISNPNDTIETETRLMTLSAQKRDGKWQWIAITNQQTIEYFDDLTRHKIIDFAEYFKDTTQKK